MTIKNNLFLVPSFFPLQKSWIKFLKLNILTNYETQSELHFRALGESLNLISGLERLSLYSFDLSILATFQALTKNN